jgi:transcriptional regulator with XRE-family HTH domain
MATPKKITSQKKFGSFGSFLKTARERRNITQSELAKKLGYSTSQFISNWERGLCDPPLDAIPEISQFLGISKKDVMSVILEQTKLDLEKRFSGRSPRRNL